jgi:hypothetical protein
MKKEERMSHEELEIDRDLMKTARDWLMLRNANLVVENYELKQQIMNNKTPEDEEFERIEREQAHATAWRKRQIEDEKERRCSACNHLLNEEGKHDHVG